jgi:hypothetical protein
MDSIQLGENLTRSTARKVVDEQLQTVVKVQSLYTNLNLSALMLHDHLLHRIIYFVSSY